MKVREAEERLKVAMLIIGNLSIGDDRVTSLEDLELPEHLALLVRQFDACLRDAERKKQSGAERTWTPIGWKKIKI